jgi:DNA-binding MarR family transcriptional regulator
MAKDKTPDPVGQVLIVAARRHRARQGALLAELGLFPGQDQVLRALLRQDGLTMSEIAAVLQVRPPTASKMAARMGAEGLVERRSSSEDARLVTIYLTEAGRALEDKLHAASRLLEKQLLTDMDDKDARRLRRLLKRASRNLRPAHAEAEPPEAIEPEEDDAA